MAHGDYFDPLDYVAHLRILLLANKLAKSSRREVPKEIWCLYNGPQFEKWPLGHSPRSVVLLQKAATRHDCVFAETSLDRSSSFRLACRLRGPISGNNTAL